MMSQRIGVLKFRLRQMKLSQVRLRRGTCEFGVPRIRLAGELLRDSDLSRSWSPACSGLRRRLSQLMLLQASGVFSSFLRHELCYARRRLRGGIELLPSRGARGKMMPRGFICLLEFAHGSIT
jgi:hypothetical protein